MRHAKTEKSVNILTQYKKLYRFLSQAPAFRFLSVTTFLITLLYSLLGIFEPEILRRGIAAIEAGNTATLTQTGVWALVFGLAFCATTAAARAFEIYSTTKMLEGLQVKLYQKVLDLRKDALAKFSSGSIISNIINNLESIVNEGFMYGIVNVLRGACFVVVCVVYMALIDWRLCIAVTLYDFLLQYFCEYCGKKLQSASERLVAIIKNNNGFLIELLNNMITIRAFHRESFFSRLLLTKEKETQRADMERTTWNYALFDLVWMGMKLGEYLVMYGIGGVLVYLGTGSIAALTAFVSTSMLLIHGINFLIEGYSGLKTSLPAIDSVDELMQNENVEQKPQICLPAGPADLCFEHVSFSFGDQKILNDVSFTVHAGEKVLLKGENGSGKSTLLNLAAGLYRPDSGRILFGGEDIAAAGLDALSQKYCYISQNSNILPGTIYENLSLCYGAADARCDEVLEKLRLQQVKDTQPKQLSEGEKQRLNIGRALYRKDGACMVLGDEIFANVDKDNADRIAALLAQEFSGKTVLLVCHEAVRFPFDRVLLVENGGVKEVACA